MREIVVFGDSCRDIYHLGEVKRINPEAPTPILNFSRTYETVGMARNVKGNLDSLQPMGLTNHKIFTNTEEIKKERFLDEASGYILLRLDTESKIKPADLDDYVSFGLVSGREIAVISDYGKGFITEEFVEKAQEFFDLVILDTKKQLGEWSKKCTVKINEKEFSALKNPESCERMIVTLGKRGAKIREKGGEWRQCPGEKVDVCDVCGAGDTFLAALAVAVSEGYDWKLAIRWANWAGAVAVRHRGTVAVKREDLPLLGSGLVW